MHIVKNQDKGEVEQDLASQQTYDRSYWGWVFTGQMTQMCQSTEER